ncbi:MAG TPA: pyrroline-5-carboxylate reductase [bacterium]|jgi:pyrroline-5-carboxylate reductase|nr:pyrroline-5-carboxylate reductase [bacterium]
MSTSQARISFVGAGNMGEAMLRGLAKAGHSKESLRAFDLRAERLEALASAAGFTASESLTQALDGADIIVLAVKPQSLDELLGALRPLVRKTQTVVSIAAGVRLQRLSSALAPATPLIRVMPNTPGLIGQGISAYCLGPSAGEDQASQVESLLRPLGKVLRVREEDMDAVTALSGSGPAYVFLFMEALQASGESLGLSPEAASLLAGQTLAGAAAMIQAGEKSPTDLRIAVTSPGGTTAAALKVLEDGGFRALVAKALRAARDRSQELGRG